LEPATLRELIRQTGGLRQPVAPAHPQYPLGGVLKADAVPDGDVDGGDAVAGAEDEADEVGAVPQLGAASGFRRGLFVAAYEATLGHAYGGDVQEEAQVAGDAEASGVGEAVAVDEEEVRRPLQLLEGAGEDGHLAEGEEAGDVGEGDGLVDEVVLDEAEVGVGEEDDGAAAVRPFNSARGRFAEGDVGAGDVADPFGAIPGVAFGGDLGGEAGLDGGRLGGGDAPGVEVTQSHGGSIAVWGGEPRPFGCFGRSVLVFGCYWRKGSIKRGFR